MTRTLLHISALMLAVVALASCAPDQTITPVAGSHDNQTTISHQALDVSGEIPLVAELADARPVMSSHAMVVSAQHLATQVGVDILKDGGNAVDAAVAVGYALAVVHPCCGNIGGGGFMVIHQADGKNLFLDFREKAPLKASPTMFQDADGNVVKGRSTQSFQAVGIPGTVMGLNEALAKYGSMSRAKVIEPAIRLAQDGYVLKPGDVKILGTSTDKFERHPDAAATFLNDGKPWQTGERLVQSDLANTLRRIAKGGDDGFYKGPVAQTVVDASNQHGGLLSMQDFADYTVQWDKPIQCDYRGYVIISSPPPSSGGTTVCEILQILKPYPLGEWGYGSVKATHYMVEAERHAYADRNTYLGDPAFINNPIDKLLSAEHAAGIRERIQADKATPSSEVKGSLGAAEGQHTTHYSVVDAKGNAVAVTYTVNYLFGMGAIAGDTGFFLNNEMDDFTSKPGVPNGFGLVQGVINQVEAGKRPLSSMTPTIVLKDGKLAMVTGSPGGSTIITTVLQTILNVVDFDMNMQQAVNAPRVHHQWLPDSVMVEKGYLTPDTRTKLEAMGHTFREVNSWGAAEAIRRNPENGKLEGANDRRRSAGMAAGY